MESSADLPANLLDAVPAPSAAAVTALAPTGTLRAAINLSNFLLVTGRRPATTTEQDAARTPVEEPDGVSPDMARALAAVLGVPVQLLPYPSPGAVADDGRSGRWDVGNIGAEPQRAQHIDFTSAYSEIEATYLVPAGSPLTSIDEVDRSGVRIASAARAAYDLWLERNLSHAELVRATGLDGSFQLFVDEGLDALAGLRARLITDVERLPGARILDGRFTAVQQAMGTPKGRDGTGFEFLQRFVEAAKISGFVADRIARHGVDGRLSVADPAAGQGPIGDGGP